MYMCGMRHMAHVRRMCMLCGRLTPADCADEPALMLMLMCL